MVRDTEEFGRRALRDDEEASDRPTKRSRGAGGGLHRFAGPSSVASAERQSVENGQRVAKERFEEFVAASVSLRGAIAYDSAFQGRTTSDYYGDARKFYADNFHKALSNTVKMTSDLDEDRQIILVEMACNAEKVADSGHAIDALCQHLDDFGKGARSTLLLHAIRFFPGLPANARVKTALSLSKALESGYLESTHVETLKSVGAAGKNLPSGVKTYFGSLLDQLEPGAKKSFHLERLPPEVLQNILLRTVEDEVRGNSLKGFEVAADTIGRIAQVSKILSWNAEGAGLLDLNFDTKSARSTALKRYDDFMKTSAAIFATEEDENFDIHSPDYLEMLETYVPSAKGAIGVVKYLNEAEQTRLVSEFCEHGLAVNMATMTIMASTYAEDFLPKSRSEMLANLIQLIPFAADEDYFSHACNQLAKAHLAGYLELRHHNALKIVDVDQMPGLNQRIAFRIESLERASLENSNTADLNPVNLAIAKDPTVVNANASRQALLLKLDDRTFSR